MNYFAVRDGQISVRFHDVERDLLSGFFAQVRAILFERATEVGQSGVYAESGGDADSILASLEEQTKALPPPQDPVIARLLPSGRLDGAPMAGESAIEFRRLTERDLRSGKMQDAERAEALVGAAGGLMTLDDATALLRAINDVRLSLGARLEVEEDTPYPRKVTSEQDRALAIYFWIGGVQEQLLEAIVGIDADL